MHVSHRSRQLNKTCSRYAFSRSRRRLWDESL